MKISQSPDLGIKLDPKREPSQAMSSDERERLSAQFEALLVHELVKSMRATVQTEDSDFGVSMSMDMMDQALSDAVAGRLGLGEHLLNQIDPKQPASKSLRTIKRPPAATPPTLAPASKLPSLNQITQIHARPVAALPVDGVLSSTFGERIHPISGKHKHHDGIDIAADQGKEIYAVQKGTVTFAGERGGYGKTVEVRHADGTTSRYAHASKIHVRVGDRIEAGECLADVGSTGHATGPHLHFEIRKFGRPIDPIQYLNDTANKP